MPKGYKHTEETRRKMSEIRKANPNRYWQGRHRSEETKEKLRKAHTGRKNTYWKGKHRPLLTQEMKDHISKVLKAKGHKPPTYHGENHPSWKGDKVGYNGIHMWIRSQLGAPDKCVSCRKTGLSGGHIQWANISLQYKRDLTDWIRLCAICHSKFDSLQNNNQRKIWLSNLGKRSA